MATKKYLDSVGVSYLWLRIMEQFSAIGHNHDDLYLSLKGGTVNGDITANKFVTAGASATDIVLGDGSYMPISSLAVDSTTKLATARQLWGNSFDGTADVAGDIKIGTLTASRGLRIDDANGFIGFSKGDFEGISLGWGASPEVEASSLRISDTVFKYKGYDVSHAGNFTYNGEDSTIYVPTSTGDVNDILASAGTGAPTWNKPADISVGSVLTTVESDVTGTTQATDDSTTKIATTEFVHNAASTGKATLTNALIYKGTIGTGGTVETLPENYSVGDTYKVITPGTSAGQVCEAGDMIVAIEGGWTVVQNNTDIATSSATGMVKGGTTVGSEKIYGINISGTGAMTVSVPWDDTTGLAEDEVMDLIENILHPKDYLAFTALEDGTFSFVKEGTPTGSVSYSLDNGSTWTALNYGDSTPTVATGSKVLWKGDYRGANSSDCAYFSSTGKFNVSGNIMSLTYGDDFGDKTDLTGRNYCFSKLFKSCSGLIDSSELILPATTLAQYCYSGMFFGCSSLTTAPEVLPATTLASYCYSIMFANCTSLTTAPELPATKLADYCYNSMFSGCTSLTKVPNVLPATKLVDNCYYYMFQNCSSLTTAPELPATEFAYQCYERMFNGCSKLNYIKAMFTSTPGYFYTKAWVERVSSTGTFVKNAAATWDVTGSEGIPAGWTVKTATA